LGGNKQSLPFYVKILINNNMTKYVLVKWPESQELYCHSRLNECYHLTEGEDDFMVPEDLYDEIYMKDF
jgi:hypothetical protein